MQTRSKYIKQLENLEGYLARLQGMPKLPMPFCRAAMSKIACVPK